MIPASFAVVGAGAVGTSLALRLNACGMNVSAVQSRSLSSAEALAEVVCAAAVPADHPLPGSVRAVFLCVPDDHLDTVAERLSERRLNWDGMWVGHTSGALTVDALSPLSERGASCSGWHPLQTFPRRFDPDALVDCFVGIEGAGHAAEVGRSIALAIGARPMRVPTQDKGRYHLAAAVSSNFLVALLAWVEGLSKTRSADAEWNLAAFEPLIRRTVDNVMQNGPLKALTGPLARGDVSTIAQHLHDMQQYAPEWRGAYVTLARTMLAEGVASGRIAVEAARRLEPVLSAET